MVLSDLHEGENSFLRLAENLPGIVYRVLIEEDNRMIFFNDMVQTMTGYSPEDLKKGKVCSIDPLILPEDRLKVINIVKEAIENNIPFEVEYRINNKSGELKWFLERGRPIRGDNGNPSYIDGVIFDITERKETEQKLKESEKKFKLYYENAPLGYQSLDSNGNILEVNKAWINFFGYSKEEVIGKRFGDFIDSEYLEVFDTNFLKFKETGEICGAELEIIKKDGSHAIVLFNGNINFDENGNFKRTHCIFQDITEQKNAEQKIIQEREKANLYLNLVEVIIVALDVDGKITLLNKKGHELLGYEEGELIGKDWFEVCLPPHDRKRVYEYFKKLMAGEIEVVKSYENSVWTKNGEEKLISWSTVFLKDENGNLTGVLSSGVDITERAMSQQKLIESEARYRYLSGELEIILDHLPGIIVYKDTENNILRVNKFLADAHNLKKAEMEGHSSFEFYPRDIAQAYWEDDLEVIKSRKTKLNIVEPWDSAEGRRWVNTSKIPYIDENGNVKGIIAIAFDITDRMLAEQELKESEEEFRKQNIFLNNILESLTHPFYVINVKDYTISLANSTASSEGLEQGQYCYSLTHNNNKPCEAPCVCPLDEVKKTKRTYVVEHIHYDKEGNEKTYKIYGYPILDESGNVVQMIEYALNISDRKKAEQKLIESEEKFRTIAERTLMGILITQDNQVKYVNDALLNMFEYSQKEIADWEMDDLTKLIHSEDLSSLREYREHLRSGDKSFKPYNSYRVFTKSGKMKWIDQFSKEILYRGRSAELVTIMDITEKKEVEHELIKLNNMKSELLRRTSHELRTPLVSIKGFSDLLLELHRDKLDDYVIKTINLIRGGCSRLESLVNDILKTAELESGTVQLEKYKGDFSHLIKICVGELKGLLELRNHTINLNIPDNLICTFEKEQIYNVITNILSNAIKYTPSNGKIEVKSEINSGFIIISIKDNGIGFTEEEKTQIFKQFGKIERYGQGYDVISEGSGLGLYISKKIVELHGGEIWVESEGRDKGSTFYFSLPIDEK